MHGVTMVDQVRGTGYAPTLIARFRYTGIVPQYSLRSVSEILSGLDSLVTFSFSGLDHGDMPVSSALYHDGDESYGVPEQIELAQVIRIRCESPLEVVIQLTTIIGLSTATAMMAANRILSLYMRYKKALAYGSEMDAISARHRAHRLATELIIEELTPPSNTVTEREALERAALALALLETLDEVTEK